MLSDNKALLNVIKQLETPMMKALAFAIKKAYDLLPKNNGKIYISNILGFFVNEKNKEDLINEAGFVPKLNKESCRALIEELAKCDLIQKFEGSRSAVYLTFNNDLYEAYKKELSLIKAKEIKDSDLAYIGFAIKTIAELYPMNKGNVYVSTIYSFFVNEKNHQRIKDEFGSVPTYSKDEVELLFNELANRKIIVRNAGDRGATSAKLNSYKYQLFLDSLRKEYTPEDLWAVAFAIKRVSEQYPQNKGNVYISNIYTYFLNEHNHNEIKVLFEKVPILSRKDVENIVDKLVENKIAYRKEGSRGASYVRLNEQEYLEFVKQFRRECTVEDFKAIVLAIKEVNKQYPQNKGNIYISNIYTYFLNEKNHLYIKNNLGEIPNYSKRDVENISSTLVDMKILIKVVGGRGATYLRLDSDAWDNYMSQFRVDFTLDDYKAVVFAAQQVNRQYPQNKGHIYVSNVYTYFINEKNHSEIKKVLIKVPTYSKFEIENIVNQLVDLKILRKIVGSRGASFIVLDEEAWDAYLLQFLREFTLDDFKAIVFAAKCVNEQYPQNKGNIYASNIYTFYINKNNFPKVLEEFKTVPEYSKYEVEKIIDKLVELKIFYKVVGSRGATYIRFNENVWIEYLSQFRTDFTINDYIAIVFAAICVDVRYPQNKGNIYVSNIYTFYLNENNFEMIKKVLIKVPKYTKYEVETIVQQLVELKILIRIIGSRGATYVRLDKQAYDRYIDENFYYLKEDDVRAIVYAVKCLNIQYPKNKGKVYLSNISTFFKDKRNFKKILDYLGLIPTYTRDKILTIIDALVVEKILLKFIGPKGAVFVRLNENRLNEYLQEHNFTLKSYCEVREETVLKILSLQNGASTRRNIYDIIFNDEGKIVGKEMNLIWADGYLSKRKAFTDDQFNDTLNSLFEKQYIKVSGNIIKLTKIGIVHINKKINDAQ